MVPWDVSQGRHTLPSPLSACQEIRRGFGPRLKPSYRNSVRCAWSVRECPAAREQNLVDPSNRSRNGELLHDHHIGYRKKKTHFSLDLPLDDLRGVMQCFGERLFSSILLNCQGAGKGQIKQVLCMVPGKWGASLVLFSEVHINSRSVEATSLKSG